jgi:hypothetical protein
MQPPDTLQVGSATRPPRTRGLPTWLVLLIVLASVPLLIIGGGMVALRAIERDHYAFIGAVQLGQTQADLERRFGKPRQSWTPEQAKDLAGFLGPDETLHPHVYYHTYRVIAGQRPTRYDHVCVWHTGVARGEFVFFDEQGKAICILSGRS